MVNPRYQNPLARTASIWRIAAERFSYCKVSLMIKTRILFIEKQKNKFMQARFVWPLRVCENGTNKKKKKKFCFIHFTHYDFLKFSLSHEWLLAELWSKSPNRSRSRPTESVNIQQYGIWSCDSWIGFAVDQQGAALRLWKSNRKIQCTLGWQ